MDNIILYELSCPSCGEMLMGGAISWETGEGKKGIDVQVPSDLAPFLKAARENGTSLLKEMHVCKM